VYKNNLKNQKRQKKKKYLYLSDINTIQLELQFRSKLITVKKYTETQQVSNQHIFKILGV